MGQGEAEREGPGAEGMEMERCGREKGAETERKRSLGREGDRRGCGTGRRGGSTGEVGVH